MTTIVSLKRQKAAVRSMPGVRGLGFAVLLLLLSARSSAIPLGPEFRINATTVDTQSTSNGSTRGRAVATNGTNYVVVWQSAQQDGNGWGVFARLYDAVGSPQTPEFPVNTTTVGDQRVPSVGMDADGNFVVAWDGNGSGDTDGVFARQFDFSGTPQAAEFLVNETTTGGQAGVDVTVDKNGDFIVVWAGSGAGDADGVFFRRFNAAGVPQTSERLVNVTTAGVQSRPGVAVDSNKNFVIAWDGPGPGGDLDVFFQRFDILGTPLGAETVANTTTSQDQSNANIARASGGRFVVVWQGDSDTTGTVDLDVYAQAFNVDGTANGSEAVVNSTTAESQIDPSIGIESSGDFVVSWSSDVDASAGVDWDVMHRAFARNGVPVGNESTAPTTSIGSQGASSIAIQDVASFLVVWHGNGASDAAGVFARAYGIAMSTADIALTMTVSDATPGAGDQINFFITVDNNGPNIATGVRVIDILPAGLTYVTHFATQGDYDPATGAWDIASMAVSSADVLRITVQVDAGMHGQTLTNTATVTAVDQIDGVGANDTFSVDVIPELAAISVSAAPQAGASLAPGGNPVPVLRLQVDNVGSLPDTLRTLTLTNSSAGIGSQSELDASWSALTMHEAGNPQVLAAASFVSGTLTFAGVDAALAPGASLLVEIWGAATRRARDSDVLDLRIDGAGDFGVDGAITGATWPIDPPGAYVVDGMSSAQIEVHDVPTGNVRSGSTRNLCFDFTVPANGYTADVLQKLNIINFGSAGDETHVSFLEAWADDGDGVFDPITDTRLGTLVFTGNRWEITGLATPVPVTGRRIYISADIAADAPAGGTLRFGLADDTDVAIGMASANDGPLDASVSNRFELSISLNDRVTLNAGVLPSGASSPGTPDIPLLRVAATNSYATNKRLVALTVTNASETTNGGNDAQLDSQLELLKLHRDDNDNGVFDGIAVDPVIATTFLSRGRASFSAFAWDLPPGVSRHLFVSADVSLDRAADGDILAVQLAEALDLVFDGPTATIATWPLDSGARWVVNGMVAAQVQNHGAPGVTLGPGDGPALALDVTLPSNGYAHDVLQSITLQNAGSAAGPDLFDMRLWRDGGDGSFTPGSGDDTEIGPLVLVGQTWRSPQLSEGLTSAGTRLFVGVTVAATPTDSTNLRLRIPTGGIQTTSGNDGPLDASITNPEALLLSSAPLLTTLSVAERRSTVGQNISVSMHVRNVGAEAIRSVAPSAVTVLGDATVQLVSGPAPASFDLAPSATSTFQWTYQSIGVGQLQFSGSAKGTDAVTSLERRSLVSFSNRHEVLQPVDSLLVQAVGTTPFSVLRGETDVVPVSLTLTNSGGPLSAEIALTELRLRVENDAGAGLVPADVLSRIALSEGNITYVEQSPLPTSGSEVLLTLSTPVVITSSEPVTVSLRCDVVPATQVSEFRITIAQASWLVAFDAVRGEPVKIGLQQGSFPLQSGLGRVRAAPTQLDVTANAMPAVRASYGQTDVLLLDLELGNDGIDDLTSEIVVGGLEFSLLDSSAQPLADPSRFFERVRIKSGALVFEEHTIVSTQDNTLALALALPMHVPVNSTTNLTILGDVATGAPLGEVRLRLSDPDMLDARDANTNVSIPVVYANAPLDGGTITLEFPATGLRAQGTPLLPTSLSVGSTGVVALVADLRHPDPAGSGRVRVQTLHVSCRDEARRELDSDAYVDQLRLLAGAQEIARITEIPSSGRFDVPLANVVLEPGETTSISVEIDLEATAPSSFFEILVSGVVADDVNLSTTVSVTADDGAELPLVSGLTRLESPATELVVGLESRIPAVLVGDGTNLPMARLALTNTASEGSGTIQVDRLVLRGGDRNATETNIGKAMTRALAYRSGQLWATSDSLTTDSPTVTLQPSSPLQIQAGETVYVDVAARMRANAPVDGFRLGVQSDDVVVQQPSGAVLLIRVESEAGTTFPLWTQAGSFSTASLRESFANFPNPFAAGRAHTTFAFYLSEAANVTLQILSPRGELVATLLEGEPRNAGMHQSEMWNGHNQRDRVVTNGVFVAELEVVYGSGRSERVLRKVAVVR